MRLKPNIMKKILLILLISFSAVIIKSQDLGAFYEKGFGIYTHITTVSSTAEAYKNYTQTIDEFPTVLHEKMTFFSINCDYLTSFKTDPGAFSFEFRLKMFGDLWHWMFAALKPKKHAPYYSSLFEFYMGGNVIGQDDFVVAVGPSLKCYIINSHDNLDPDYSFSGEITDVNLYMKRGVHFPVGAFIRADKAITDWLAIRCGFSFDKSIFVGNASDKVTEPTKKLPFLMNFTPEIFTKSGFFIGCDYLLIKNMLSNSTVNKYFSGKRIDIKIGWRLEM